MGDLVRKLSAVRRRLMLLRLLHWSTWGAVGGLWALGLVVLVVRLGSGEPALWGIGAGLVVGGAVAGGLAAALLRPVRLGEAALRADVQLELRERLSSALMLASGPASASPAFAALEHDAQRFALAISPARDFRLRVPRHARHLILPAVAVAGLWAMPPLDLFSGAAPPPPPPARTIPALSETERLERAEELRELARRTRETEDELKEAGDDLNLAARLERLAEDISLGEKTDQQALAEMSRLSEELRLRERDAARPMQAFRQLRGLQNASHTRDLQQALKDQDFGAAAEMMTRMAEELASMPAEEKREMARELSALADALKENPALAEALEQAASAMEEMASAQESAGGGEGQTSPSEGGAMMDGSAAGPMPGLQSAMNAMQQASAGMENLQQLAAQAQRISELQRQMSDSMTRQLASSPSQCPTGQCSGTSECAACAGGGSGSGGGDGWSDVAGMGTGEWAPGSTEGQGSGTGGPGQGRGGRPPDSGTMGVDFEDTFIPGQQNEGEIIAVFEIDAPAPRGDSVLDYTRAPAAYQQQAAEAITSQEIPAGMRNVVRDYFEALNAGREP